MNSPEVLYEDNHLLIVNKPAHLATMGDADAGSLHRWACDYVRVKYAKPGRVFIGIVSRLDAMTTGAIVLARTSKAASRLTPQFADHSGKGAIKTYLVGVQGRIAEPSGVWIDDVFKDDLAHRMRVVARDCTAVPAEIRRAELQFRVFRYDRDQDRTFAAVRLLTGRKHQIRVQFAARGHAILGDRKYDAAGSWPDAIALHSYELSIVHPTLTKRIRVTAPLPRSWHAVRLDNASIKAAVDRFGT